MYADQASSHSTGTNPRRQATHSHQMDGSRQVWQNVMFCFQKIIMTARYTYVCMYLTIIYYYITMPY